MMLDQGRGTVGQAGIHEKGKIGGIAILQIGRCHQNRDPLPADIDGFSLRQPSCLAVFLENIMVALGDSDFAILEGASLLVTHFVSRKNDVQGHLLRFVHHH